jgi:polyhydroxyalkanoate synthase
MINGSPKTLPNQTKEAGSKETILEITRLITKLLDIYATHYHKLLPNELLQYSHGLELFSKVAIYQQEDPTKIFELQNAFIQDYSKLLQKLALGDVTENTVNQTISNDKRFDNPIWNENSYFNFLKSQYFLIKKYCLKWLHSMDNLDHKTKQQLHFYTINYLQFLAPTNNLWTNPEVIQSIMASNGSNLLHGFKNYLDDLVLNNGQLNIRMTDVKAFAVGKNLAVTPGKVIYQNDLIQLIQYSSSTDTVFETPILFVPPWINKYYVLDLSPHNSLVKWLVAQGFTVFMISWINPGPEMANKEFADYMLEGPIQAVDVITKVANCSSVHMVGYCIGGTLLSCALAYMQHKKDFRAKSSTFFMSLLNFSNPGELGVFLDDPQIDALEKLMESYGYLNGRLLEIAFNTLRPNDLIWPYFIHNYLLGKPSKPFDLLYWNADSSNLPYKMYIFYLRNMYLHNRLKKPGGIKLDQVPINLSEITTPAFFLASETDHITLWRSVYSGLHLLRGPVEFILSESGHVRGVINPPFDNKYGFKTNDKYDMSNSFPNKTVDWLLDAAKHQGSWWPYWVKWLQKHDSNLVPARIIPAENLIEDAPGSYVKKRI